MLRTTIFRFIGNLWNQDSSLYNVFLDCSEELNCSSCIILKCKAHKNIKHPKISLNGRMDLLKHVFELVVFPLIWGECVSDNFLR